MGYLHPTQRVPTVQEYREIEAQRQAASATSASQAPQSASDELPPGSQGQGVGQSQAAPAIPDGLRQRKGAGTGSGFQTDGAAPIPPPKDGDEGRLPPKDDQVNQAGGGADEKERIKQQMAPKGKANEIKTKGER